MPEVTILVNREDAKATEEQERLLYIHGILKEIGIPIDEVWPEPDILTIPQKIELRKLLRTFDIVIRADGGDSEIFVGPERIAKWFKPRYIMKKDPGAIEKSNRLYFEMTLKTESLFDVSAEEEPEEE